MSLPQSTIDGYQHCTAMRSNLNSIEKCGRYKSPLIILLNNGQIFVEYTFETTQIVAILQVTGDSNIQVTEYRVKEHKLWLNSNKCVALISLTNFNEWIMEK